MSSRSGSTSTSRPKTTKKSSPEVSNDGDSSPILPPTPSVHREFNDKMSSKGSTSHIPTIVRLMYITIISYSFAITFLTDTHWYTQIVFYFVYLGEFYLWHYLAHQKYTGRMHQIHCEHHFNSFPPSNFYGNKGVTMDLYGYDTPTLVQLMDPRRSTNFTIYHEGILYALMIFTLSFSFFILHITPITLIAAILLALTMGSVGSALHSSFHVKGFQLENYSWYLELRALHYIHHLGNTKHNYGVLNIEAVDGIFNSMRIGNWGIKKKGEEKEKSSAPVVVLPDHITSDNIQNVILTNGSLGRMMLMHNVSDHPDSSSSSSTPNEYLYPTVLIRFILIGLGIYLWQCFLPIMENQISSPITTLPSLKIHDVGHHITQYLYNYIVQSHDSTLPILLHSCKIILSNVIIIYLISLSLFGKTIRPALGIVFALILRSFLMYLTPFIALSSQVIENQSVDPLGQGGWINLLSDFTIFSKESTSDHILCPHIIASMTLMLEGWEAVKRSKYLQSPTDHCIPRVLFRILWSLPLVFHVVLCLTLRVNWSVDVMVAMGMTWSAFHWSKRVAFYMDYIKSL